MIEAPIKDEFLPEENNQFYSSEYKFSKSDFENKKDNGKDIEDNKDIEEEFYDDESSNKGNGKFFFKILLLIFGITLVVVIAIYLISYFNRV